MTPESVIDTAAAASTSTRVEPDHRLGALVERFGGTLSLHGAAVTSADTASAQALRVDGFAPLAVAVPTQLAFLANPRYRSQVLTSRAGAVLVREADALVLRADDTFHAPLWVCADPYLLYARVAQYFAAAAELREPAGIAPGAMVAPDVEIGPGASIAAGAVIQSGARIGAGARIGPGCVIGRHVCIGADTLLHARVTIYDACIVGARGIIHAGAVIGADGFGFARDGAEWVKIPQTGRVVIGDDVEIGANTTIDRGAMADTVIGNGVKLDNQIQIGHNCRIGDHTAMAGCAAIAGSTVVGQRCTIGGAANILGHLTLADDVHISAITVVSHSIHKPGQYSGFYPMDENAAWEKSAVLVRRLPDLRDRLRRLERRVAALAPADEGSAAGGDDNNKN